MKGQLRDLVIANMETGKGKMRYAIKASAQPEEIDLLVYDDIAWYALDPAQFVADLAEIKAKKINLKVNSLGGEVYGGLGMFNALVSHSAKVETTIEGIAASIASVIALAGDKVRIAQNAFFFIHDPWTRAAGNSKFFRKIAADLDVIAGSILGTYVGKSNSNQEQIRAWMEEETLFNAEETVSAGFAQAIINSFDEPANAVYNRLLPQNRQPTEREIERLLRDAGVSRSKAVEMAAIFKISDQRDSGLEECSQIITNCQKILRGECHG